MVYTVYPPFLGKATWLNNCRITSRRMLGFDRYAIALNPLVDHHIPQKRGDMLGGTTTFWDFQTIDMCGSKLGAHRWRIHAENGQKWCWSLEELSYINWKLGYDVEPWTWAKTCQNSISSSFTACHPGSAGAGNKCPLCPALVVDRCGPCEFILGLPTPRFQWRTAAGSSSSPAGTLTGKGPWWG